MAANNALARLKWVDSHCHFDFDAFRQHRSQHWQLAQSLGLSGLIIPGIHLYQSAQLPAFCAATAWHYAQGLHPYFLAQHQSADIARLAELLQRDQAIAVGEIGLDWTLARQTADEHAARQQQWWYFTEQARLAEQQKLPLILHIRGAHDEAASWLRRQRFSQGGIVHAFSGSVQQGQRWLELGFKLGIGGAMTFPRAQKLRRTLQQLPLHSWLLESDAPDMRPSFFNAGINSPVAVPLYGHILAALTVTEVEEVAAANLRSLTQIFPTAVF